MLPVCILIIEDESDRTFMSQLFQTYHRLMYSEINQIVPDAWAAEDLLQASLEQLLERIDQLRHKDQRALVSHIAATCRNLARNYMREQSRLASCSLEEQLDLPALENDQSEMEWRLVDADERVTLLRIWPKLDERSRHVLEGRYILKKSDQELAQELGIKPDSIRMVLSRARRSAFRLMKQEEQPPEA